MGTKRPKKFPTKTQPASAGVLFWIELILWIKVIFLVILVGTEVSVIGSHLEKIWQEFSGAQYVSGRQIISHLRLIFNFFELWWVHILQWPSWFCWDVSWGDFQEGQEKGRDKILVSALGPLVKIPPEIPWLHLTIAAPMATPWLH